MPVSFLSPAQRDSYGQYLGDPSTQELARYFHLDDSDHTQIVEKRGDANRLGFALQLTTVRFVGTFLDDPTAVPPAVLATMSRQLGIDTTTDLTGYRDGKWRFAHAAQIRTEHGYRDLADRAAGFGLTRWLYAQCWTGTERPSALFDRATTWMLAHKVLLPGATTLERFVAKLRHRVDVRVWRVLTSGISPPQQRRLEDLLRVPDEGRSSSLVTLRTGAAMVSGPALVRALERLNAVRSLSITVPAAAAIAPTRIAALARFAEKAKVTAVARLPALRRAATLVAFVHSLEASAQDDALEVLDRLLRDTSICRRPSTCIAQMATRCVQKTRRDCHRSATSTSTCWDATRSPYLNRSLGASSGRSETPLTAVANRTFRSIAPQTPNPGAPPGVSPLRPFGRPPTRCAPSPSPSTRHFPSLPCGSGRQAVRFRAESRDDGRAQIWARTTCRGCSRPTPAACRRKPTWSGYWFEKAGRQIASGKTSRPGSSRRTPSVAARTGGRCRRRPTRGRSGRGRGMGGARHEPCATVRLNRTMPPTPTQLKSCGSPPCSWEPTPRRSTLTPAGSRRSPNNQQRIGEYLRLRTFDAAAGERLARFLEDEALRLERTTSLLARARAWLRDEHVLAPADSVLRRAVGAARHKARRLDALVAVDDDQPHSPLHRIKASSSNPSVGGMKRLLARLELIEATGVLGNRRGLGQRQLSADPVPQRADRLGRPGA